MNQYDAAVSKAILALARDPGQVESDPSWSQEQAEAAFFRRLTLEEELDIVRRGADGGVPKDLSRVPLSATQATWRKMCGLCVPLAFCCVSHSVFPPIGSAYVAAPNLPLSHP
jgi:hypothetical protein